MREILFRGKKASDSEWVEGHLAQYDPGVPFIGFLDEAGTMMWFEVKPDTVGQFTGLLDVDGVKIFEGDIIQNVTPMSERKFVGPVRWSGLFCNFSVNEVISLYGVVEQYRVVGNSHDNMEV